MSTRGCFLPRRRLGIAAPVRQDRRHTAVGNGGVGAAAGLSDTRKRRDSACIEAGEFGRGCPSTGPCTQTTENKASFGWSGMRIERRSGYAVRETSDGAVVRRTQSCRITAVQVLSRRAKPCETDRSSGHSAALRGGACSPIGRRPILFERRYSARRHRPQCTIESCACWSGQPTAVCHESNLRPSRFCEQH